MISNDIGHIISCDGSRLGGGRADLVFLRGLGGGNGNCDGSCGGSCGGSCVGDCGGNCSGAVKRGGSRWSEKPGLLGGGGRLPSR